jgi:hypothetical protein
MDRYVVQKVDQALMALGGSASQIGRLREAQFHLGIISAPQFLSTVSEPTQKAITAFTKADLEADLKLAQKLAFEAIWTAAKECGVEEWKAAQTAKA